MSGDERAKFLAWYEKTKEKKFHNNEELLATAWITLMC
jgi:hypothetical protein